jgi:competence protein ComEC
LLKDRASDLRFTDMTSRTLGHRAPLLWLVLPFMGGLAIGKTAGVAPVPWLLGCALVAAGLAVTALSRAPRLWAPALVAAMALSGWASYALHRHRLPAWDALPPREVRLALRLDRAFPQADERRTTGLATIVHADGPVHELSGQRLYYSLALRPGESAPLPSAVVLAAGVLAVLPRDPPADTFDGYLANSGINFRLTRGRVLREEAAPTAYARFCAKAARQFSAILGQGVAMKRPELTATLRAMLLGQQNELNEEQILLFRQSGTMHIFSISGLHIAVIAGGLQAVLSLLRLPRAVQFPLGLATLWLYVDITGAAPSAVRAFVMVAFLQSAFVLRVPANPVAALTASVFLVLLAAPLQIFSASFQMSYGIVAALLLLGLPLADAWEAKWTPFRDLPAVTWRWWQSGLSAAWHWIVSAIALGLAAALVGAASGVLFFRLFTPGALLVNLALIPASSLVILAGFVSLLGGLAGLTSASVLFNHAAVLLLWGIDRAVREFLRLPAMWFAAHFDAPWLGAAILVSLLALMLAGYQLRWEKRWGGFWPPFVLAALVLGFGLSYE